MPFPRHGICWIGFCVTPACPEHHAAPHSRASEQCECPWSSCSSSDKGSAGVEFNAEKAGDSLMPETFLMPPGRDPWHIVGANDRAGQKGPILPPLEMCVASFPSPSCLFFTLSLLRRLKVWPTLSWGSSGSPGLTPTRGSKGVKGASGQRCPKPCCLSKEHLGCPSLGLVPTYISSFEFFPNIANDSESDGSSDPSLKSACVHT